MQGHTHTHTYVFGSNHRHACRHVLHKRIHGNSLFHKGWCVTDFVFWLRFSKGINPSTRCLFKQKTSQEKNWVSVFFVYVCVCARVCEREREIVILYGNYKTFCSGHFVQIPAMVTRGHPVRNCGILFIFSSRHQHFLLSEKVQPGRDWEGGLATDILVSSLERHHADYSAFSKDVVAWISRASVQTFWHVPALNVHRGDQTTFRASKSILPDLLWIQSTI